MASRHDDVRGASLRLALQTGALLLVLLSIIAGAVLFIVGANQSAATDRLLAQATQNVDSVRDAPAGVWLAIEEGGQTSASDGMPAGFPDRDALETVGPSGAAIQTDVSVRGATYTVRTQRSGGRVVQAVFSLHENQEEIGRLASALLVAGGGGAVLASLLAAWLARRVMRPMAATLELQRRFVADASHELRTPLTILSTRAQLLQRELTSPSNATSPTAVRDVAGIVGDARSLADILEDLLIAADPRDAGAHGPVDLVEVADDVVQAFTQTATQKRISLTRSGASGAVVVVGTPASLRRVFVALIDNALEFARSSIDISVVIDSRDAVVTVRDDGPGFPEELKFRAFERFATLRSAEPRVDGADTARHYGLGLSLVAEVAARNRGSVALGEVSDARGGAVIIVRLPMARRQHR